LHKNKTIKGFTKKYGVDRLVYSEEYSDVTEAIAREKAMKQWLRKWKVELIEKFNPAWDDLYEAL
jgi:putative endonuclease